MIPAFSVSVAVAVVVTAGRTRAGFSFAAFIALLALAPTAHGKIIHVAPTGSAGAPGTLEQPLATVQEGLDRALAGDTVRLAPGVYRERVSFKSGGNFGAPVVLEGPSSAIVDGSWNGAMDWQPAPDIGDGVYRLKNVPFSAYQLTANGHIVIMVRENRTTPGKAEAGEDHEWPKLLAHGLKGSGFKHVKALGIMLDAKKELLVHFEGDLDPRQMTTTISVRRPAITISRQDRCVVRGLSIRNAAYGVWIDNSLGSVVENCTIGPADFGVWLDSGSDRCTVRFNDIFWNQYGGVDPKGPAAQDQWNTAKRAGHNDRYGVQIYRTVGGHEVHDNFIHDHWDGIEDRGQPGENVGLRIHHNLITGVADDGLEPNGAGEDCQWYENVVKRTLCGLRLKAITNGPTYVYRNIFLDNREDFRNFGAVELKPAVLYMYHNTSTAPAAIWSNKVFGIGTPNYHYFNNLFWCTYWWRNAAKSSVEPNWKGGFNVFARRGTDPQWDETKALAARLGIDQDSLWTEKDPGFEDGAGENLALAAQSPARGRGADLHKLLKVQLPGLDAGYFQGKRPDAGALQFGEPMPRLPRRPQDGAFLPAGLWPDATASRRTVEPRATVPAVHKPAPAPAPAPAGA